MKQYSREEIINRVRQIQDMSGDMDMSKEEHNRLVDELESGVIDPNLSDYIFWSEMTAEEIANKVLSYKPIMQNMKIYSKFHYEMFFFVVQYSAYFDGGEKIDNRQRKSRRNHQRAVA